MPSTCALLCSLNLGFSRSSIGATNPFCAIGRAEQVVHLNDEGPQQQFNPLRLCFIHELAPPSWVVTAVARRRLATRITMHRATYNCLIFWLIWWALQDSTLRPLPCEGSALPLS